MPNSIIDRKATASAGERARGRYTSTERNVHLGEHSTTKRAVPYIVVLTQGARDYSFSNIQATDCEAAADGLEGRQGDISISSFEADAALHKARKRHNIPRLGQLAPSTPPAQLCEGRPYLFLKSVVFSPLQHSQ
jgi:hypothetical protein